MILEIKNLTKSYSRGETKFNAVDTVNLNVEVGDYINIIGRSGSGKSTLLNIIAGLLKSDEGSIIINNKNISDLNDNEISEFRNKNIGFVPQGADLIYNLTVIDNVRLPFYLHKRDGDAIGKAKYLLELLGLEKLENMYPQYLSGGEIKRVLIARALMNDPSILIADEPTSDLDVKNTKEVMEIFKKLNEEQGLTIVVVTHELDTLSYGKTVYTMTDGRLESGNMI